MGGIWDLIWGWSRNWAKGRARERARLDRVRSCVLKSDRVVLDLGSGLRVRPLRLNLSAADESINHTHALQRDAPSELLFFSPPHLAPDR
jgi:hypothetical protein